MEISELIIIIIIITKSNMQINFNSKYQGCVGICVGRTFTFPGFLIGFFLIAMKAPISTKGVEQHNHSNSNAIIVENGTAALEPSAHKNKFIIKNIENDNAGYKNAVIKALISQLD